MLATSSVDFTITGDGVDASGRVRAELTVTNVAELNNARNLNGAESVDVDLNLQGTGQISGTVDGEYRSYSESINVSDTLRVDATDAANAGSIPTSGSATITESGYAYGRYLTVTATASYNLGTNGIRDDVDVVENRAARDDFFITNEGTGTPDYRVRDGNIYPNYGAIRSTTVQSDAREAHAQGWTGKGIDVVVGTDAPASNGEGRAIAPGVTVYSHNTYNYNGYAVGRSTTNWRYENNTFTTDDVVTAATTALVLHKYDTLTADQGGDIVTRTRDANGGVVSINKALSPVGNLR